MKNENIKRINGIGKACRIITKIAMVICIIGVIASIVAGIMVAMIPNDSISINGDVNAEISVNLDGTLFTTDDITVKSGNADIEIFEHVVFTDFVSFDIDKKEVSDTEAVYSVTSNLSETDVAKIKKGAVLSIFEETILVATIAIFLFFASKLAGEVEKCETPFTEDIIKKLKNFGWSLIPFAVLGGIGDGSVLTTALFTLIIIMIINVFAYGAELQQESDETL